jgi:cell division protein FtsZ
MGALFTVKGGPRLTLGQVNAAGRFISKALDPEATIFFGMHIDPNMGDEVRLTLIATGIPDDAKVA